MSQIDSKRWYVVYSKPHGEERAQLQFRLKGVEYFFPKLLLPCAQKHKRIVPLFPNYLFVRIQLAAEFHYVLWSHGVKRFVSFSGVPEAIDDRVVEFLMRQADADGIITTRSNLKAGQEIRISRGPFEGLVGIIQKPADARGRVEVLLSLLRRQVKAEVPIEHIESGWVLDDAAVSLNGRVPAI